MNDIRWRIASILILISIMVWISWINIYYPRPLSGDWGLLIERGLEEYYAVAGTYVDRTIVGRKVYFYRFQVYDGSGALVKDYTLTPLTGHRMQDLVNLRALSWDADSTVLHFHYDDVKFDIWM